MSEINHRRSKKKHRKLSHHKKCKKCKKCHKKKCTDNNQVLKAVAVGVEFLTPGYDFSLTKIPNTTEGVALLQEYLLSNPPGADIYHTNDVVNLTLDLEEVGDIDNIDHIDAHFHVMAEITQNMSITMFLTDVTERDGVTETRVYTYVGHDYTLNACQWSKIAERWDRPRLLNVPISSTFPAEVIPPTLKIVFSGIQGKLIMDKSIQVHVEYCREDRSLN